MQPIPGFDPQPDRKSEPRVVGGIHVTGCGGSWRIIIGLIIVGWGLLLTAANLHLDPAYYILAHWYFPCALTTIGLLRLAKADSGVGRGVGGLLTALGAWWLVSEGFGIRFDIWDWWPLALVVMGILIITRSWSLPSGAALGGSSASSGFPFPSPFSPNPTSDAAPGATTGRVTDPTDAGPVSAFAFWSGVKRRVSAGFKRANIAAFMGGVELDLRPAIMVGGQATIEVFVLMGGLEITVPPDWNVANEALVVLGGVDDRSSGPSGATQTLIIKGLVLMGGVEIKT